MVKPTPDSVAKPPGLQELPGRPLAVLEMLIALKVPETPEALLSTGLPGRVPGGATDEMVSCTCDRSVWPETEAAGRISTALRL